MKLSKIAINEIENAMKKGDNIILSSNNKTNGIYIKYVSKPKKIDNNN